MELSNHFEAIVETLVNQIYNQVQERAQENVNHFLDERLAECDFDSKIKEAAQEELAKKIDSYEFDTRHLGHRLASAGEQAVATLKEDIQQQISETIKEEFAQVDVKSMVRVLIEEILENRISRAKFPEESIPWSAIKFDGFCLSGDGVVGGIITNFGSTGIDDRATSCQLTILDTHTIIESPLVTTGIEVRGDAKILGKLEFGEFETNCAAYTTLVADTTASVKESLNTELFSEYSDLVTENIRERGIEFKEVLINGKLVLAEEKLGPSVVHSNLRRVGELKELQVSGEAFLSQTLYTANRRVGINTIEPTSALTVWDEEVEMVMGKKSQNRGFIGSNRQMAVTLGTNNKDNLTLDTEGSVTINDLRLGAVPMSTASVEPNWEGRAGEIVFTDSPAVGKPIGWVCLEGHRWAKFGIVQE